MVFLPVDDGPVFYIVGCCLCQAANRAHYKFFGGGSAGTGKKTGHPRERMPVARHWVMTCISAGLAGNAFSIAVAFPKRASRKPTSAFSTVGRKMPSTMISAARPMALRMIVRAGKES